MVSCVIEFLFSISGFPVAPSGVLTVLLLISGFPVAPSGVLTVLLLIELGYSLFSTGQAFLS